MTQNRRKIWKNSALGERFTILLQISANFVPCPRVSAPIAVRFLDSNVQIGWEPYPNSRFFTVHYYLIIKTGILDLCRT